MADCNFKVTNRPPKFIASELRKTAQAFDPFATVRAAAFWFFIGAATVAAMDYGDVWLCAGQCGNLDKQAQH